MVPNLLNLARPIAVFAKIINLEKTANLQHSEKKICQKMLELRIQRAERALNLEMEEKLTYVDCCPRMDSLVKTKR